MRTDECYYCERRDNLQQQICGFWFCWWCLPRAEEQGAWYWYCLATYFNRVGR